MNIVQHDVAVEIISAALAKLYRSGYGESEAFDELKELLHKVMCYSPDQLLSYDEIIKKCDFALK